VSERITLFADLVLPLAVPRLYTYRVPLDLNDQVQVGMRAVVQFGKSKLHTGIIRKIHQQAPKAYEAKYIETLLDDRPIVNELQMKFWDWLSSYYLAHPGEIMNAALPGSLRLGSETKIVLLRHEPEEGIILNNKEQTIIDALQIQEILSIAEIAGILNQKTVQHYIKSLIDKGMVLVEEELKFKYKPKFENFLSIAPEWNEEEKLRELFSILEKDKRAGKRTEALLLMITLSKRYAGGPFPVKKPELVKGLGGNAGVVETLIKNNILLSEKKRVDRLGKFEGETIDPSPLSEQQLQAFNEINSYFEKLQAVLLHGVTSSGKTEVYIHLINSILKNSDKQVLYLLPEIALTSQIINRLRKHFGDYVGVFHSKFNDQERAETWSKTLRGEYKILIGARSSIFLPFTQLGLIIVDEEHENSFKQFDPSPRYHARDAALLLGNIHGAKVLLGSATPSIESYYNAEQNKFGLVQLTHRYGGVMMPEIQCVDIREATKKKKMHSHFSEEMLNHIKLALENNEQVILFQNRRGYSPFWMCQTCGWVPKCRNCDVSLTYHKATHQLQCHYCTTVYPPPKVCSACGSHELKMLGFGTEKIEEDLSILVPGSKVARMDLDTTRSKNAYHNIISDFEDRKIDILVGTQMITKGLDFDNVALVGILNADSLLNYPDFRAFERSYQLIAQVSGRAGRKNKRGKVLIQTMNPNHWIIQKVMYNEYENMYKQEILERRNFHYPPFVRLIRLTLRNKDQSLIGESAQWLAQELRKKFDIRVLGPEEPMISRIRNYYYRTILLKFERGSNYQLMKEALSDTIIDFRQHEKYKKTICDVDVDPV
jgi:primosomal protein N' (replication factor Y) (superfamily II helicase)